jgi:hypothetical protein
MTGKSKRPRLQTTVASDIAPRATQQFTHSSNTSTRTRQIVVSAAIHTSEDIDTPSPLIAMEAPSLEDFHVSGEVDPPAGIEVLTKARRYVNSVRRIFSKHPDSILSTH